VHIRDLRLFLVLGLFALPVAGQDTTGTARPARPGIPLSLEEAVRRAVDGSQEVRLARSQVNFASAAVREARADLFPQITGAVNYTRTFEAPIRIGGGSLPDSLQFMPDPTASIEERLEYLERNAPAAGLQGIGALFSNFPIGQDHAYTATLSGSQTLFSPDLAGALRIAGHARRVAELEVTEAQAEIELQVRSAYVTALLARELEGISEAAVAQARGFLADEQLRETAGTASELEVLRAEVELANLEPQLIAARNNADLAESELKRLLDIPLDDAITLTTPLAAPSDAMLDEVVLPAAVAQSRRAAIESAERQVQIREAQRSMERAAFLPTLRLRMNYGTVVYPNGAFNLRNQDWLTDWNMTVGLEVPIFTGFRRLAKVDAASAQVEQAELQLAQLRENVQLQYQQARNERIRARATIGARGQTVAQAERVHDLTALRCERGLATQLEVSDARLALLQARTNLAQALAEFYIADAGVVRAAGGRNAVSHIPTTP
jgi:outer membrane protein TolC